MDLFRIIYSFIHVMCVCVRVFVIYTVHSVIGPRWRSLYNDTCVFVYSLGGAEKTDKKEEKKRHNLWNVFKIRVQYVH